MWWTYTYPLVSWSQYQDANPVPTSPLADDLATAPSGQSTSFIMRYFVLQEASYEPAPRTLPAVISPEQECLLLTINLSSNGEIVLHRNKTNKSVDTGMYKCVLV